MKKENIVAIDVVILPQKEITDFAIGLSKQLRGSPLYLTASDYLPHITIAMGYIRNLGATTEILENILRSLPPFELHISRIIKSQQAFNGFYFSHLEIENSRVLRQLHNHILTNVSFVSVDNPPLGAFVTNEGEAIVSGVYDYIHAFKTSHSGDRYWPHITLGAGSASDELRADLPKTFRVEKIALCKLGNFCTCRKKLGEWGLGNTPADKL